jgi:hypothetical protein
MTLVILTLMNELIMTTVGVVGSIELLSSAVIDATIRNTNNT